MATHATPRTLPPLQLEDCLALLRALVAVAWLGVAAAVFTEAWVRASGPDAWPTVGDFPVLYRTVMIEFALNTVVLSLLLMRTDWFERMPRASIERVRVLLLAVMVWLGLHEFYAFYVAGGASGPLLALLPTAMLAALLSLPGAEGAAMAGYLLAGHLVIAAGQQYGLLPETAPLAGAFAPSSALGAGALALALGAAIVLGLLARGLFLPLGFALHHPLRLDPFTGLFLPAFLERRLAGEIGRAQRGGGGSALLLIALDHPLGGPADDRDASWQLHRIAQVLTDKLRFHLDTPTRYGLATLAALLPTAEAEDVRGVARRLSEALGGGGPVSLRFGAALVGAGAGISAQHVMATAEQALAQAHPKGDVVVLETTSAEGPG
jgi:hypothetical protein